MDNGGLSAGDILALSKGNTFDWSWIIGLLVIAGIFGGGFGFGANDRGVTQDYVANQFTQRDIYNNNTSILTSAAETQKEILNNRFENALAVAGVEKDVLIGQQVLQGQLASCCCDIKSAVRDDGDRTRAIITAQYEATLLEKINDLKAQLSNQEQTISLLNTMGKWYSYPSYTPPTTTAGA